MYDGITPPVLATEAIMTLAAFEGVIVFVEGPTDLGVFQDFLPEDKFRVIHGVNKDIAVAALAVLDQFENIDENKKSRIVALVDADFDRPLGILPHDRCFPTDYHDLELMMIWSSAFARLLRECGAPAKVAQFGGEDAVREKLVELGGFVGAIRLYAKRSRLAVDFDGIRYDTYLDRRSLAVNRFGLCQGLFNANRAVLNGVRLDAFLESCDRELESYEHDHRDLAQGHDLVCLLGIMLRTVLSSMDARDAEGDKLGLMLRLAYRPDDWYESEMARSFHEYLQRYGLPSFRDAAM